MPSNPIESAAAIEVSVIIVNWNSKEFLRHCLKSVEAQREALSTEVIVIDNASYDGTEELLKIEFPSVVFIQAGENLGFARANNRAAACAKGEHFLFLNPDTEVLENALCSLLKEAKQRPDYGVIGACLLNTDRSIQTSCLQAYPCILNQVLDSNLLRAWFPRSPLWGMAPLFSNDPNVFIVEGVSGACLLTSRKAFEKVGGFSEEYFMYYEDMDFCLKCQNAGLKNFYVPGARVVHHGGKSSGGEHSRFSSVMMAESAWRYFRKHQGKPSAWIFRLSLSLNAAVRFVILAAAYPILALANRGSRLRGACKKWTHVLRWSLGRETWSVRN